MHPLYELLRSLEKAKIHFELERYTPQSVTVIATIPGIRLEIDVFEDGRIEYSEFKGDESVIEDNKRLQDMIEKIGSMNAE